MKKNNENTDMFSSCLACNKAYAQDSLAPVFEGEHRSVFHGTCPHCQTSMLFFSIKEFGGVVNFVTMTDLDKNEIGRKVRNEEISADDILDVYEASER